MYSCKSYHVTGKHGPCARVYLSVINRLRHPLPHTTHPVKPLTKCYVCMCVCVCEFIVCCRLSRVGAWLVLDLNITFSLRRWCEMRVSFQDNKMRNPVLALLSLSTIIMLAYAWPCPKMVLTEQVVIKLLLLRGCKTAQGIVPDAVQRYRALYQMPQQSKGPRTSTLPFLAVALLSAQSVKLHGMRLQGTHILCPVSPPGILPGLACVRVRACLCVCTCCMLTPI